MPAAPTRTSTSPDPGTGSRTPWSRRARAAVSTAACISALRLWVEAGPGRRPARGCTAPTGRRGRRAALRTRRRRSRPGCGTGPPRPRGRPREAPDSCRALAIELLEQLRVLGPDVRTPDLERGRQLAAFLA